MPPRYVYLFGGDRDWSSEEWTSSDDRVRGGKSQSYLDIDSSGTSAIFKGTLDIKTLGGAGFASQRTTGDSRSWNLSRFDGIELSVSKADSKCYTFILKDDVQPKREDGREQSTVSWEYDFTISSSPSETLPPAPLAQCKTTTLFIPWAALKPTYRGKPKPDAPKLDRKRIKRFSIMNRSFFGDQEGDFSLELKSIAAVQNDCGYEQLAASVAEKGRPADLDIEAGIDEKTPLARPPGRDDDALGNGPQGHVSGRRERSTVVRMIVYGAMAVLVVHGALVLHMSCAHR